MSDLNQREKAGMRGKKRNGKRIRSNRKLFREEAGTIRLCSAKPVVAMESVRFW